MISISVNESSKDIHENTSLEQLIHEMRDSDKGIAVAINNVVISRTSWNEVLLRQDDRVLIIQATQGG